MQTTLIFVISLFALVQSVYGIQITASGGSNLQSGSVNMIIQASTDATVAGKCSINGAVITPQMSVSGSISKFEQTHAVTDSTGKYAGVYVKVMNAPNGITYSSKVLPSEGNVGIQPFVSAEQWLTVTKADSIKCTATSSYGSTRYASVGLEEYKDPSTVGDYVTLAGYYGKALTTGTSVLALQTATTGIGSHIELYGSSKDSSGLYSVNTVLDGLSVIVGGKTIKGKASFTGMAGSSSAGPATQTMQSEHVYGSFTSMAKATAQTTTRTSNYGSDYDLSLSAAMSPVGPVTYGALGYYVTPFMKVQGAVNAAQSGDTINIAAWTFKENIHVDKSLTLTGAGASSTIIDGNKAGSVFTIGSANPNIDVTLSGLKILNGKASYGGGILNMGKLKLVDCTISGNSAQYDGGGVWNSGNLYLGGTSQIVNNQAIAGYGGGIYSNGGSVAFDGTKVAIKSNKAQPATLPIGTPWYKQYGVNMTSGAPAIYRGFNPATQVTGNTHI